MNDREFAIAEAAVCSHRQGAPVMNKQTRIALHLARVMGKPNPVAHDYPDFVSCQTNPEAIKADERGSYGWQPHRDLSQWAECVIWAAMNGCWPDVMATRVSYDAIESGWIGYVPHDGTTEGIQDATLEAIARATGWEESK